MGQVKEVHDESNNVQRTSQEEETKVNELRRERHDEGHERQKDEGEDLQAGRGQGEWQVKQDSHKEDK
jgi:hypothetical protein